MYNIIIRKKPRNNAIFSNIGDAELIFISLTNLTYILRNLVIYAILLLKNSFLQNSKLFQCGKFDKLKAMPMC